MKTKELSMEFLELSIEEIELIKDVKDLQEKIIKNEFDIHNIHVGIGFFSVNVYSFPYSYDIEMKSDSTIIINKREEENLTIKIENIEVYNNIIDKINEKIEKSIYLSVKIVKQEKNRNNYGNH